MLYVRKTFTTLQIISDSTNLEQQYGNVYHVLEQEELKFDK